MYQRILKHLKPFAAAPGRLKNATAHNQTCLYSSIDLYWEYFKHILWTVLIKDKKSTVNKSGTCILNVLVSVLNKIIDN